MIKAVIFDMDGVIIDSADLHLKAWQEFFKNHNKTHTKEEFKKYFGMVNKEIFKLIFPEAKAKDYNKLDDEKEALYRKYAETGLRALPGADRIIKSLYGNLKLFVASSGHPTNIEFNLKKLNLWEYFEDYLSSRDIIKGKPDPEIFLKAAQKLNLKPEECVVIEDSYHGVEAAKRAGMKVIAITTTHDKLILKDANLIVDSLNDLNLRKIQELE